MNVADHCITSPLIAIVGRPNVGKSTLFNALCRRRKALVYDEPGVTRDLHYSEAVIEEETYRVVDTGGLFDEDGGSPAVISEGIRKQVLKVLQSADLVLMVMDGRNGLHEGDKEFVQWLRVLEKPVLYLVNKIDHEKQEDKLFDFYALGVDLMALSSEHRLGFETLKDTIHAHFEKDRKAAALLSEEDRHEDAIDPDNRVVRLSIIGRPNVGKSTLMNCILGEDRSLVTAIAGTTRDSIDEIFYEQGRAFQLVDTAGVRSQGKTDGIEGLSVIKALHALKKAHLAILVLDLSEGITEQDCKVAGLAHDRGRGLLIFGNKTDLLSKDEIKAFEKEIYERMPFIRYAPFVTGSALKKNFPRRKFFSLLQKIERARHLSISTGELNRFVKQTLRYRPLPMRSGRALKVYYMTQALAQGEKEGRTYIRPSTPRFVCFVNNPKAIHYSDKRYLINSLRKEFQFFGNPIDLQFRARESKKGDRGGKNVKNP